MLLISFWTMLIISSTFHYTATQKPVLTANSTDIRVNEAVKLTCTFTSGTLVQWKYQGLNGTFDIIQSVSAKLDGTCLFDPDPIANVFNQCECSMSTNTTCTLKGQTLSNTGDVWQCIVTVGFVEHDSNLVKLQVTEETTTEARVALSRGELGGIIIGTVLAVGAVGAVLYFLCICRVSAKGMKGCYLCRWKRLFVMPCNAHPQWQVKSPETLRTSPPLPHPGILRPSPPLPHPGIGHSHRDVEEPHHKKSRGLSSIFDDKKGLPLEGRKQSLPPIAADAKVDDDSPEIKRKKKKKKMTEGNDTGRSDD